tara:strand:- start:958 stop:1854 length:897 start_codon:yes stop_codon:yes gene_type:complete
MSYVTEWSERDLNNGFTYQWNPTAEGGPKLKITKSSLGAYGFCPASYVMNYNPFGAGKVKQEVNEAMLRGTIVHNAQEDFWKAVDVDKAMPMIDDPSALVKHFREYYPEGKDEETRDIYRAMSAWNAERFLECVTEGTIDLFVPAGNEIKLDAEFEVNGVTVHLQGIIDRVFFDDGGYIPLELKTGPWKDSKKSRMRKEMAFYQLLFEECEEQVLIDAGLDPTIGVTHWGWFFPASNYIYVEEVKKRSMTSVLNSLGKLVDAYLAEDFPYQYFYKKCDKCGFKNNCEAAGGGTTYDWF